MMLKLPRIEKEIKIGHAICMDIDPYEDTAPYEDFELATFQ